MFKIQPQAFLFDLDGTLVDSAPDLCFAVNSMLRERGSDPVELAALRNWVGNGARRLIARALTATMDDDPPAQEWDSALERFYELYAERLYVDSQPYPGAIEAVRALHGMGVAVAVVTNKPYRFAQPIIEHMGLGQAIKVVVGGDCAPARKPDPQPLHLAASRLGVDIDQTVMVGDSATDVAAARAAGVPVICVSYGYRRGIAVEQLGADMVLDNLRELPELMREAV
ncbi:phosphoglycolate phosphatase [Halorhodospira halochloris]|uniref:Phosphoglycolate phosphatase n=1 Tax=Halorhodospira halochloris TaxID=1052 RepID=A0A0X8XBN6_HALHR|nr:phosphoglycolate phosphatase [Halorhodospira halochloris]MBK1651640.1 phosphoglycolate phosphatase [Halorhodospira halochloris]MCG5529562.1 phosphoglycolate phosphatase [Halorhodospira halochloris]MCG5548159.1 phosphoglycolate phosphatase [Halorhodospira halochloris]BAU58503.1 phosphoglycolate phosphatase [Halorhodospira halochloris]